MNNKHRNGLRITLTQLSVVYRVYNCRLCLPIIYLSILSLYSMQTFGQLKLPIEELDLSNNLIRRIPDKAFEGLKDSLNELRLANNLLGDNLNPIFSTAELHSLKNLRLLDLSGNKIKLIEEGVLKGCMDLKEFYMDRNSLTAVPVSSLNGPSALRHLSLRQNYIGKW